jgi:Zn-dependent metalloprotease
MRPYIALFGVVAVGSLAVTAVPAQAQSPTSDSTRAAAAVELVRSHPDEVRGGDGQAFTVKNVIKDPDGTAYFRISRSYKSLPVIGGDTIVRTDSRGDWRGATQNLAAAPKLSTEPALDASRARAAAVTAAAASFAKTPAASTPRLVVDASDGTSVLAWQVSVSGIASDQGPRRLQMLLDANTGAVRSWSDAFKTFMDREQAMGASVAELPASTMTAGNGRGYYVGNVTIGVNKTAKGYELKDPARGNGETRDALNRGYEDPDTGALDVPTPGDSAPVISSTTTFGDNTLSNRATVAVDAQYGIQQTWDYYQNVMGRNGIYDDGNGVTSYVHYLKNWPNAAWSDECSCMIYGDGPNGAKPFTGLDVAGHEMTHGVTAATAGLDYSGDAGGINEAVSDIFGTQVAFYANNPKDKPTYMIGKSLDLFSKGTPLRYMDDPKKDGKSFSCWTADIERKKRDLFGSINPHYSSGVGNHWFFLAAVGSGASTISGVNYNSPTCNGAPPVQGIGNDKAAKILYRALTTKITSTTETYPRLRMDTILAANELYGAAACASVKAAWLAVGVKAQSNEASCSDMAAAAAAAGPAAPTGVGGAPSGLQVLATDPRAGASVRGARA